MTQQARVWHEKRNENTGDQGRCPRGNLVSTETGRPSAMDMQTIMQAHAGNIRKIRIGLECPNGLGCQEKEDPNTAQNKLDTLFSNQEVRVPTLTSHQ